MKDKNANANKMASELFISTRENNEFWLPPKSKEEYLKVLEDSRNPDDRSGALRALVELYRIQALKNKGRYTDAVCGEVIGILEKHGPDLELSECVVGMLLREGGYCEGVGDFDNALRFYESSLRVETKDPVAKYFRLNNCAFCLNFMKRFEEAEKFLRSAIELNPEKYNAWKNLGISLEHQLQFEEAAECYMRAVITSRGETRSIAHLLRLVERYPTLRDIPILNDFLSEL